MARAYSKNLVYAPALTGVVDVGSPPEGKLWIIRNGFMTFGSYFGYVRGGLGLLEDGPWSWILTTQELKLAGVSHQTVVWEGRYVVPAGSTLYIQVENGDTADFKLDGYELSVDGSYGS